MNDADTIAQLNTMVATAKQLGFVVRHELLDGQGAAVCQIKGRHCLFLDLSCGPAEQLEAIGRSLPAIESVNSR